MTLGLSTLVFLQLIVGQFTHEGHQDLMTVQKNTVSEFSEQAKPI